MKKLVIGFVILFGIELHAQDVPCDLRLSNAYLGKEFWFVVPVDDPTELFFDIQVYAPYGGKVQLTVPGMEYWDTPVRLQPGEAVIYTSGPSPHSIPDVRIHEYPNPGDWGKQKIEKVVHIVADTPVVVRVYALTHGDNLYWYQVYPVQVWGKRYILTLRNGGWGDAGHQDVIWPPNGFLVLANEDRTQVQVRYRGKGEGWVWAGGKRVYMQFPQDEGKTETYLLNRGEAVAVIHTLKQKIWGADPLDWTGTYIEASAPVAVVAFNLGFNVPYDDGGNDAGLLFAGAEMLPPVESWGTEFVMQSLRNTRHSSGLIGDDFRVVAAEDDTYFEVQWYDPQTGQLQGQWSGLLQKAGDFLDYAYGDLKDWITGYSIWRANKPVTLIHFGSKIYYEPTLAIVPPVEQYLCEQIFYFRPAAGPITSLNNIAILEVDAEGDEQKLGTIRVNEVPLLQQYPSAVGQRVPGTDYWAIRLENMESGGYRIRGDVQMGVNIYGAGAPSRSIPGTGLMAWNRLGKLDTVAPRLQQEADCGTVRVVARDDSIAPPYEDLGISRVELLSDRSYNYRLVLENPPVLENRGEGYWQRVEFRLQLLDPLQDGKAVYGVVDWAGNVRVDSVLYQAPKLAIEDTLVDMDTVRVGRWKEATIRVINRGDSALWVDSVWLARGEEYWIVEAEPQLPAVLGAGDTLRVRVGYAPKRERQAAEQWDVDTVQLASRCGVFRISLVRGQGVQPHIAVGDWDARTVDVGAKRCNDEPLYDFAQTVRVRNDGSAALVIRGIDGIGAPFELDSQQVSFPIRVEAGEQVYVKGVCFAPQAAGTYEIAVVFRSDGVGDSISVWRGRAIGSAPYAEGYEWDWVRVGQQQGGRGRVINGGEAAIRVDTVWIDGQDAEQFRIEGYRYRGMDIGGIKGMSLAGGDTLEVLLAYAPQQESAEHVGQMVVRFTDGQQVAGQLRGKAYVPRIGAEGYRFACVEIGDTSAEVGRVRIWNAGEVGSVEIEQVELEAGAFWWEEMPQVPVVLAGGDTVEYRVRYAAQSDEDSSAVVIRSNAGISGEQEDTVWVIGCGIEGKEAVVKVSGYDYGEVIGCEEKQGQVRVENVGEEKVQIEGVRVEGADAGGFEVEAGSYPMEVGKGEQVEIGVRFVGKEVREYRAEVVVELSAESRGRWEERAEVIGKRQAEQERWRIELSGEQVQPGQQVEGWLVYEGSGQLDWVQVQIRWNGQGMRVESYEQEGSGWEWEEVGRGNGWMELQGRGQQRLAEGGVLRLVYGIYLQADSVQLSSWVAEVEREGEGECVQVERGGDQVQVREYCLREARGIAIGSGYGIAVEQEGERLVVRYGVGLQGRVQIEIYGQMGEKVAAVVDRQEEAGWKQLEVEMPGMASGVYYVRYRSGRYEEVVPLWWVR